MITYVQLLFGPNGPGVAGMLIPAVIGLCVGGIIVGLGFVVIPPLTRFLVPKPTEPRYADYLPFLHIGEDRHTVVCKQRRIAWVWRLESLDHSTQGEATLNNLFYARYTLLTQIANSASSGTELRLLSLREATQGANGQPPGAPPATSEINRVLRQVTETWNDLTQSRSFRNHHYLAAYTRNSPAGRKSLQEIDASVRASLSPYSPRLLEAASLDETTIGQRLETPLTPFASFLSPATRPNPNIGCHTAAAELLACDQIAFHANGRITFTNGDRIRHAAILGMKGIPDTLGEQLTLSLLRVEGEITLVHTIRPLDRRTVTASLDQDARVAASFSIAGGGATDQITEVSAAIQGVHPSFDLQNLFQYQLAVFCYGEDEAALQNTIDHCQRALSVAGLTYVCEGFAAESTFWTTLPTFESIPRPWRFMTDPIAALIVPQGAPEGLGAHDWGPRPITQFRSAEGAAYRFTFHAQPANDAPGHTMLIAPTGAGKTTLISHLASQVLANINNSRVWFFDRLNGAECATLSLGGHYVRFDADERRSELSLQDDLYATLNPFLLDDTDANRRFLHEWTISLVTSHRATTHETVISPEDEAAVARAISIAYDYAHPSRRQLKYLYNAAFSIDSNMRRHLMPWVSPSMLGRIFNSSTDTVGDLTARWVSFDCTTAFDHRQLAAPLILYLMHRIRSHSTTRGQPTLIVIDETEPMLENPTFKRFFRQSLQEARKLRQVFICCFQRPSAIERLGIGDLIRGQCPTVIFMRNPQATAEDYASFDLTQSELNFIRGNTMRELPFAVLVKRYEGPHTAIIDTSLHGLGNLVNIYSSGRTSVLTLRRHIHSSGYDQGVQKFINT